MKKIGIYGGSFNPPGLHHYEIAKAAANYFDVLYVVPCGVRKDKASISVTSNRERSMLAKRSFGSLRNVEIDYRDLIGNRFTPTWRLQELYASIGEVWHVVGPDLVESGYEGKSEIQKIWEKGAVIWQKLNFAVITPFNYPVISEDLPPCSFRIPMKEICGRSHDIRALIAGGQPFEHLVLPRVAQAIKSFRLYGYTS